MKRIIRLTESDLTRIVRRVISEQPKPNTNTGTFGTLAIEWERFKSLFGGTGDWTSQSNEVKKDFAAALDKLKEADKWVNKIGTSIGSSITSLFEDSDEY